MTKKLKYIATIAIVLLCISCKADKQTDGQSALEKDLVKLLEWFPGEYDNHQQVHKELIDNISKERRHRQTHHIFFPIQLDFIPGKLLYAQQSQHYDLNDIYRQRIYAFTIDSLENAIRLTIYTPKNPNKLINAHLNPSIFKSLAKDDFYLKPGCDVFWKKANNQFEGYLKNNACNYYSEKFNTTVYLNETLILRKDALLLNDTAVDENGKPVFGVHDKGPTINLKETNKRTAQFSAKDIMKKAHKASGGNFWKRPKSLTLKGYGIFYKDGDSVVHERHNMWRVYEQTKEDAHLANGKVRIESFKGGQPVFIVSFDGKNTYDLRGKQEQSAADKRWASNFGFGVIRHALDKGYQLKLIPDDTVFSKPVHHIKVIDPNKGETFFGISKDDYKIVKVAFQTPRGWHHRTYSNFFRKEEYNWVQSGEVALFYNDKLANKVIWEDFEVNEKLPDSLFVLKN